MSADESTPLVTEPTVGQKLFGALRELLYSALILMIYIMSIGVFITYWALEEYCAELLRFRIAELSLLLLMFAISATAVIIAICVLVVDGFNDRMFAREYLCAPEIRREQPSKFVGLTNFILIGLMLVLLIILWRMCVDIPRPCGVPLPEFKTLEFMGFGFTLSVIIACCGPPRRE